MRVVVTGGAGYLGAVLSQMLLAAGHEVVAVDSLLHGGGALLGLYPHQGFTFVKADIRDATALREALSDADAVVHLAAIVGDPACAEAPELARQVNVEASCQLIELCGHASVARFVFASTCSNYGRSNDPEKYLDEDADLKPVSLYAESKVEIERALLDGTGSIPVPTVLRFATLFGLSPRMRFDLTINEFAMELLTRRHLVVFGEQFWRPYVHVRDAAIAIMTVLGAESHLVASTVFNVGSTSQNYRKEDLVEMLVALMPSTDLKIDHVQRDEDPRDYKVSFTKVERQLGFDTTRSVQDGIAEIIDAITQGVIADPHDPSYRN